MRFSLPILIFFTWVTTVHCTGQTPRIKAFTEPYRSIETAIPEIGSLVEVLVAEGDQVNSGDILARLNDDVLVASLNVAVESSRAHGRLNAAKAEVKMQTERLAKLQGLFDRRHASQIELERATSQLEIAQAQLESAQDELRVKEFEIRRIQSQLEQRRLRSPIDGIVTDILKQPGEFVSANDPVVARVVQLHPLLIVFSVPQIRALEINVGDSADVQIAGVDGIAVGKVEFVSPIADPQSGTRRVKVRVPNENLSIVSGQASYLMGTFGADNAPADRVAGLSSVEAVRGPNVLQAGVQSQRRGSIGSD